MHRIRHLSQVGRPDLQLHQALAAEVLVLAREVEDEPHRLLHRVDVGGEAIGQQLAARAQRARRDLWRRGALGGAGRGTLAAHGGS